MSSTTNTIEQFNQVLAADDVSSPSICIPRTFANTTREKVQSVFDELNLGEVKRIDMIDRTSPDGSEVKRIFIHFTAWNTDEQSTIARNRLLNGGDIKIVYDRPRPWFWKASALKSPPARKPAVKKGAYIDYSDDSETTRNKNVTRRPKHKKSTKQTQVPAPEPHPASWTQVDNKDGVSDTDTDDAVNHDTNDDEEGEVVE